MLMIAVSGCCQNLFMVLISGGSSSFFAGTMSPILFVFHKFAFPKVLDFFFMFLFFSIIHKLPKFDLQPIHGPISFLYFSQTLLLISFHKDLNQLVKVINFFLIFCQSVLTKRTKIFFHLITQNNSIVLQQL